MVRAAARQQQGSKKPANFLRFERLVASRGCGVRAGRLTPVPPHAYITRATGRMAEWLCNGLQIRVQRFDSASGLQSLGAIKTGLKRGLRWA